MPKQVISKMVEAAYRRGAVDHQGGQDQGGQVDEGKVSAYMVEVFGILNKPKKNQKKAPKCPGPLPWQGIVCEDNCHAVRLNNGLYTQCVLKKKVENWCLACSKQAAKNASGVPDNGSIVERMSKPAMEYVDPKGRKVVAYMTVLGKLKVTREMIDAYRVENNLEPISAEYFELLEPSEPFVDVNDGLADPSVFPVEEEKKKKAKAKKAVVESVVESAVEAKDEKKKGRPKKAKKSVTVSTPSTEDLFATLLQEQEQEQEQKQEVVAPIAPKKAAPKKEKKEAPKKKEKESVQEPAQVQVQVKRTSTPILPDSDDNEGKIFVGGGGGGGGGSVQLEEEELQEEDEEEDEVEQVTVNRKKYLRSQKSGVMYDVQTQEPVGVWNPQTKKIDALPVEEEEN